MQLRLTGLILLITCAFIGMAAFATQTHTIKIKKPDFLMSSQSPTSDSQASEVNGAGDAATTNSGSATAAALKFIHVPIQWPLGAAVAFALLLWFVPAPLTSRDSQRKRRSRRRTKRPR